MNIYVGNLPRDFTEGELRQEFMAYGAVMSVVIMNDRLIDNGGRGGYGFVKMTSTSEGEAAIAGLRGKRLRNQLIDVVESLPFSRR
jgi:RNA recognition motif-containing protein